MIVGNRSVDLGSWAGLSPGQCGAVFHVAFEILLITESGVKRPLELALNHVIEAYR